MKHLHTLYLRLYRNAQGQDLIEYALMAGFVAIAAGAVMPSVSAQLTTIFSKVQDILLQAAGLSTAS